MTLIREKNGRLEPSGLGPKRFGGALNAQEGDELITLEQLRRLVGTSITESFSNQTSSTTLSHIPLDTQHCSIYFESGFGGFVLGAEGIEYTRNGAEITWTPSLSSSTVLAVYSYYQS